MLIRVSLIILTPPSQAKKFKINYSGWLVFYSNIFFFCASKSLRYIIFARHEGNNFKIFIKCDYTSKNMCTIINIIICYFTNCRPNQRPWWAEKDRLGLYNPRKERCYRFQIQDHACSPRHMDGEVNCFKLITDR